MTTEQVRDEPDGATGDPGPRDDADRPPRRGRCISRTVIREAVRVLESMGLLPVRRRLGLVASAVQAGTRTAPSWRCARSSRRSG